MLEFKCEGCVFANQINGIQNCSLNRLDKLEHEYVDGSAVLNRFCNTYRPEEWLEDLGVEESADLILTVLREVAPRVGFFVNFNKNLDDLSETIRSIKLQAISPRYVVVINSAVEYNSEIQQLLVDAFDFDETEHHIVQMLENPDRTELIMDEAFKHAKNGWVYVCDAGHKVHDTLIADIHHRINFEMKPLVVVEPLEDGNAFLFQAALFKFLNGNKFKVFSDEEYTEGPFIDKVRKAAEGSDPETFITWEKFYGKA